MRALLDVNVLVALFDPDHVSHGTALAWLDKEGEGGWASCPLTQNGCIRVMSQPGYPNNVAVSVIVERLRDAVRHRSHQFWADDISALDAKAVDASRVHGPRQLTDVYLLGLAVAHKGRLVTFDTAIPLEAVAGAQRRHLVVL